jgi:hypothetical protein
MRSNNTRTLFLFCLGNDVVRQPCTNSERIAAQLRADALNSRIGFKSPRLLFFPFRSPLLIFVAATCALTAANRDRVSNCAGASQRARCRSRAPQATPKMARV